MSNDENTLLEMPEPIFSGKTYDFVKKLVQMILPALGTLYFSLANLWDLPAAEQVVGTLTAFTLFLGVLVGISSNRYNAGTVGYDGQMLVSTNNAGSTMYTLELNVDPEEIAKKASIAFKIVPQQIE